MWVCTVSPRRARCATALCCSKRSAHAAAHALACASACLVAAGKGAFARLAIAPDFNAEIDWGQTTKEDLLEAKARAQVPSFRWFLHTCMRLGALDARDLLAHLDEQAQGEAATRPMPPSIPLQVDPFKGFGNKPDSKSK